MKAAGEEIACAGGDEEAGRVPCSVNDSLTTIPTLAPPQCLLGGNTSALHVQGHATRLLQGRSTKVFKRARLGDEALSFKRGVLKPNTWKPKYVLLAPSLSLSLGHYTSSLSGIVSGFDWFSLSTWQARVVVYRRPLARHAPGTLSH